MGRRLYQLQLLTPDFRMKEQVFRDEVQKILLNHDNIHTFPQKEKIEPYEKRLMYIIYFEVIDEQYSVVTTLIDRELREFSAKIRKLTNEEKKDFR